MGKRWRNSSGQRIRLESGARMRDDADCCCGGGLGCCDGPYPQQLMLTISGLQSHPLSHGCACGELDGSYILEHVPGQCFYRFDESWAGTPAPGFCARNVYGPIRVAISVYLNFSQRWVLFQAWRNDHTAAQQTQIYSVAYWENVGAACRGAYAHTKSPALGAPQGKAGTPSVGCNGYSATIEVVEL